MKILKKTIALLLPIIASLFWQSAFSQITVNMSGSGKHPTTDEATFNLILYKSSGLDCEATITFTSTTSIMWSIYDNGIGMVPPVGVIKYGGVDIPDISAGGSYTPPVPPSTTFTITVRSTSVPGAAWNFAVGDFGANDKNATLNVVNTSCTLAPLAITVSVTPNTACIGAGDPYPLYDVTVSDNQTGTPAKSYDLTLPTAPSGLALNSTVISVNAATRTATIFGALGGQISSGAVVTGPFTIQAKEQGGPVFNTVSSTITVSPTCKKNALVVKVNNPTQGTTAWAAADEPLPKVINAKTWLDRVSNGKAVFNPRVTNVALDPPVKLDSDFHVYGALPKTVISDLVQEVVTKLGATELDQVDHLFLFLNTTTTSDVGPSAYWAIHEVAYNSGGVKKTLNVSVHAKDAPMEEIAHGIGHQFDLNDLSLFDNTGTPINPLITPLNFDIMALPANGLQPGVRTLKNIHPLEEHKFSRSTPSPAWIDGSADIHFIQKPGAMTTLTRKITAVSEWTPASTNKAAIALGLTGAASLSTEKSYAWIEARPLNTTTTNTDNVNNGAAFDGIVVYYAQRYSDGGAGNRLYWYDLDAGGGILYAYQTTTTGSKKIGDSGWSIISLVKSGNDYTVELQYDPPMGVYDALIRPGPTYPWLSPDIETVIPGCDPKDCPANGGEEAGLIAGDVDTKVIATVYNDGDAPKDVVVEFSLSRTTVANVNNLDRKVFASVFTTIPARSGTTNGSANPFAMLNLQFIEGAAWGPDLINALKTRASHYCLFARIIPVSPGEGPTSNNEAQKNSDFKEITHASPYPGFDYSFYVSNPSDKVQQIFFDTKNMPREWNFTLTPSNVILAAGQDKKVDMHIQVPPNFPDCTDFPIQIGASALNDHTLVPLSGTMPYVKLRKTTNMNITTGSKKCNIEALQSTYGNSTMATTPDATTEVSYTPDRYAALVAYYLKNVIVTAPKDKKRECATIYVNGCTNPPQPFANITMMYQDPAGNPLFKHLVTDANGCYQDDYVVVEGGVWQTTAIFNGDACAGSVSARSEVQVDLPHTGDQDGDRLPDIYEMQGDDDGDGLIGPLDPDSDNDGILDGDEPKGNYDCDSYANVIDTDSDNDGVPDREDATPYGITPQYRWSAGLLYHRFDFDKKLPVKDAGGFNARIGVNLHPFWGLEGEVGYTPTTGSDGAAGKVYNVNLNGLYYIGRRPVIPYLTAGMGSLIFSGFPVDDRTFALNGGVGVIASQPGLIPGLALRAEAKAHLGSGGYNTGGNLNWQYSVGLIYRMTTKQTPCKINRQIKRSKK